MREVMHWKCWVEKNEAAPSSQRIFKTVRITGFSTSRFVSPEWLKGPPEA